jgi:RNA polymerase sigma factor (sigma-70 family)
VAVVSGVFRVPRTTDFDRLYRRHAASVYRYAYAVLGNQADAEDVTQQTFLNAYRAMARGTKPRKAENWLLTIAHNEVRRHFRSTQGRALEVELDEQLPQRVPERSDPTLGDVLRALKQLSPAQRSALVMREFEGRSYAEIAEIMSMTPSALEALIFRARRALAEQLEGALTCAEAEQALSRRLDGRLPRRESRRLKAHLKECPLCVRFADVQKRQRSLLKSLSIMPIPASLFLFRGEQAAAAGVGAGTVAAGGSAAVGGGTAAGLIAKAAAVSAAAAVAGGAGYEVATRPNAVIPEREVTRSAAVAERAQSRPIAALSLRRDRPTPAPAHRPPLRPKAVKAKPPTANRQSAAKKLVKVKQTPPKRTRARAKPPILSDAPPTARPATKLKPAPAKARGRPAVTKRSERIRPARPKPSRPAQVAEKPLRDTGPPTPPERQPKDVDKPGRD